MWLYNTLKSGRMLSHSFGWTLFLSFSIVRFLWPQFSFWNKTKNVHYNHLFVYLFNFYCYLYFAWNIRPNELCAHILFTAVLCTRRVQKQNKTKKKAAEIHSWLIINFSMVFDWSSCFDYDGGQSVQCIMTSSDKWFLAAINHIEILK